MTITTWKSPQGRISVITSGRKGMDKVVESAFDAIDNGEEVILKNEHGDTCTLDDSLFLHGVYNVKFAIRQFAKGERVTGAVVLNGKEYPVVKAEDIIAEGERRRAMREVSEETAEVNDRRFLVSVHYDNNGANGMASKHFATAADASNYIIAFAKENPEYVINTDTNIRDFDAHKKYTLTDADLHILNSKPTVEEIAEINAADVKVNVAQDGKIIEQIKVDVDAAINIINRLNYRNDTFVYSNTTRYDNADIKCLHFDAYKDNGEKDAFAITEYVINGKLEIVRFFNLFRDLIVDLQIGNINYTLGDKGAIVLTAAEEIANKKISAKEAAEKAIVDDATIERFGKQLHFIEHSFDKNGRNIWYTGFRRLTKKEAAEELALRGWTIDEYVAAKVHFHKKFEAEYANEPMSDDISGICKYSPDIDADNKPVLLDWDDSAIANTEDESEKIFTDPAAYDAAIEAAFKAQYPDGKAILKPVIIDNGKTYTESEYAAKTATAENYEPAFTTKTDKNGRTLYYLDGKRVSRDDYFWEYDRRSEMIDEMLDKRMDWFDKPEDIYEDATTLESVSGVERDEVADVKGIGDLADRYIEIDGATAQSVEVKLDGRRKRYYIDGKRASRDRALDVCAEMRGDNHFTIEYRRESKTISRFDVTISMNDDGFSVISGQTTIHTFEDIEDAEVCVNQIEAAYLSGWHGVKVDLDGTISDLDEAEELEALATKMEARILSSPAIAEKYARAKERVEVTFSKYGYPLYKYRKTSGEWTDNERAAKTYITKCGLSETEFIIKAKHDVPSGDITDAEIAEASTVTGKVNGALRADPDADNFTAAITDAKTAEVIPVERFWCEVEIAELSEQDAADIVAHFHGQDGANKFFKMRATELDGSEEDSDEDIFGYLPALDELNDVEISDDDNTPPDNEPETKETFEKLTVNDEIVIFIDGKFDSVFSYTYDAGFAAEYSNYYYFERTKNKRGYTSTLKFIDDEEKFFALMVERGACTVDAEPAEISNLAAKRRTEKIGSDEVYYIGGKWQCTYSAKYHAGFFRGIRSGELMYRIDDLKIVSEQDFWQAMIERGACTLDNDLTAKLKDVTRKARLMEIYPQIGERIVDTLARFEVQRDGGGFIFTNGHETFARYDTEEQCLEVIRQIGVAIEFGDSGFTFPKAAGIELELNLPALAAAHLQTYGLTLAESCGYQEAYHA